MYYKSQPTHKDSGCVMERVDRGVLKGQEHAIFQYSNLFSLYSLTVFLVLNERQDEAKLAKLDALSMHHLFA